MKKLNQKFLMVLLGLMMVGTASAVNWGDFNFLGDGAGGGKYNNKYKVEKTTGVNEIVNIQHPGFATADGIYMNFIDAAFGELRVNGIKINYDLQGAGICLHLSNFTAKETEVNVMNSSNTAVRWTFHVFYAEGSEVAGDDPVESVTLNKSEITLKTTKTQQLNATVAPNTAADKTVTWKSNNEGVATVSDAGLVTAVAVGTATITATSNGDDTKSASCSVTVIEGNPDEVDLTSGTHTITYTAYIVADNTYELTLTSEENLNSLPVGTYWTVNGQDQSLSTKVVPDEDPKKIVVRTTSSNAPQISSNLYVMMPGEVNFGKPTFNWIDKRQVEGVAVTGVSIPETLNLTVGDSQTLTATITPSNASNKNVSWEITEGTDYAEVDATGKVTAKAEGIATVKVTTEDGSFTDECTVTVTAAPVITNPYCEKEVGHFLSPTADSNSFILLSIGSDGEGHTIVNIKQDAVKNSQKFDYLQVTYHASTGTDVTEGGVEEMAVKFNTPTPDVDGNITLQILWSNVNDGGRWMVDLKLPATATCASAVVPEVPKAEVTTYYGYTKNDEKGVYVSYSITRNEDNTLTFEAQVDNEQDIASAHVNVESVELGLIKNNNKYSATTTKTYAQDAVFKNSYFHFVLVGTSNIADASFTYTVGASNEPITTFPTEKVTLDKANLSFGVGDADQTLTARVYPNFATNTTVAWTTSAEGVATVSNGAVHPVGAGDATITATCGGKTATCAVNVVAALEDASYYGTGSFKTPIDNSYVAYNYNFTRKANHEVVLTVVFERDVTDYITSDNFQFFENNIVHNMTYVAATHTATYSFGNKTDGSEIVNFYFYFVLTGGGVAQTDAFTYIVGSTNEQPNKLIAINEVLANTLTDGEFVDALLGRTFIADGANYTLCLPFDMTAEQCLAAFGSNYKLWELGVAYMKTADVMYLPFSEVTSIEAGKPYLFCPATTVENPTIEGVTINAADPVAQGNGYAKMTGIYSPSVVAASNYVLGPDNWLYQSDGTQMYGLRCYFTFGSAAPANVRARAIFHDTDVVTDLETIEDAQHAMPNGKYVIDGQFVIIRNGKQYNAVGQAR